MASSSSTNYDRGHEPSRSNERGSGSLWFGPSYKEYDVKVGGERYKETHYSNGQVSRTDKDGNTTRIK